MGRELSGVSGYLVEQKEERDEAGNPILDANENPKMIETKTPVFLEETNQDAKFRQEVPVIYDFYKKGSSNRASGVDVTNIYE